MDRRTTRKLVTAGIAAAALAVAGCGDDETEAVVPAAKAAVVQAQGTDRSDAAQRCGSSLANRCNVDSADGADLSAKDKTPYFNRSDASQP